MFYCDKCAVLKDWPKTGFKSAGVCEVCGKVSVCNSMKSKIFPKKTKEAQNGKEKN